MVQGQIRRRRESLKPSLGEKAADDCCFSTRDRRLVANKQGQELLSTPSRGPGDGPATQTLLTWSSTQRSTFPFQLSPS